MNQKQALKQAAETLRVYYKNDDGNLEAAGDDFHYTLFDHVMGLTVSDDTHGEFKRVSMGEHGEPAVHLNFNGVEYYLMYGDHSISMLDGEYEEI